MGVRSRFRSSKCEFWFGEFSPREERVGKGPKSEATPNPSVKAPSLPDPLLHPLEEREKS